MMPEVAAHITDHLDSLRRYAMSLTRNATGAEDLVQETVLRALYKADLYKEGTNLRGWLLCIMHGLFVTERRSPFVRRRSFVDPADILRDVAVPAEAPAVIEMRETCEAIAKLPPLLRAAIIALGIEGQTYEQMAANWNVPLGTVKSRCFRARSMLREMTE